MKPPQCIKQPADVPIHPCDHGSIDRVLRMERIGFGHLVPEVFNFLRGGGDAEMGCQIGHVEEERSVLMSTEELDGAIGD